MLLLNSNQDWTFEMLHEIYETLDQINKEKYQLDIFPNRVEIITYEQMLDAFSNTGGLPVLYPHWQFGERFVRQMDAYKKGSMGLALEIILNTNPSLVYCMEENSAIAQALVLAHACVSGDTEYLTPTGWKKISEYDGGVVGQYEETGVVSFVSPTKYINRDENEFIYVKGLHIEQKITKDHRVVFVNGNNSLVEITGEELNTRQNEKTRGFNGKFITGFNINTSTSLPLTDDEISLHIAIKADGSYHNRSESDHFNCVQYHRVRFHLKKQRKIDRLESLLTRLNIEYIKKATYEGRFSIVFNIPERVEKYYENMWYKASYNQLKLIGDEVLYWDGSVSCNKFSSANKKDVVFIQYVWAATGKHARISKDERCWNVTFSDNYLNSIGTNRGKDKFDIIPSVDGKAYCFSVPSGMFVIRLNDKISVTGNCFGHNFVYKNNYTFKQWSDADTIIDYLVFAKKYIMQCEEKYGVAAVEAMLDACHALQYYGIDKYKRPSKISLEEEERRRHERENYLQSQVNELWNASTYKKDTKTIYDHFGKKEQFPSEPQENILYFLEKNAPKLQTWQREIIRIVRKIAQYFYPQMQNKCLHEGMASYMHYKMMHDLYDRGHITDGGMMEFYNLHTAVVRQSDYTRTSDMNPYALGFALFEDIERVSMNPTEEDKFWFKDQEWVGNGNWLKNVKWVVENFKDDSFILQFLSPKVMRDFKMFVLRDDEYKHPGKYRINAIHDERGYKEIRSALSKKHSYANMMPDIQISTVDKWGTRKMVLEYTMRDHIPLDTNSTKMTLNHLAYLWGYKVSLNVIDENKNVCATIDNDIDFVI